MEREISTGDAVIFVDSTGREHKALVTAVWDNSCGDYPNKGKVTESSGPGVNLVVVSLEKDQTDNYGRQIRRETSIVHKKSQSAPAFYWKFLDE